MSSQFNIDFETETGKKVKRANTNWEGLEEECGDCQNGENEGAEFTGIFEQVFSIPLVLKEILKNLEVVDLLRSSIVNKNWNFFSREVLRQNKKCLAVINEANSCRDFQSLNALLMNCEAVPFNGISIPNSGVGQNHRCILNYSMFEFFSNVLNKINIKFLSTICSKDPNCNCSVFVREIIEQYAGLLEELRFEDLPYPGHGSIHDFFNLKLTGQWLPNIRVLEFPFILYENDLHKEYIEGLVEASPKLEELHGSINVDCLEFILPLRLTTCVKDFHFEPKINALGNCLAFSLENPMLNKLSFSTSVMDVSGSTFCQWDEPYQNDVARIMKQILESSKESLEKVAFDHWDLILMMTQWNIPILQKVTHLNLRYVYRMDVVEDPDNVQGPATFKKINWAKYFPNLRDVSVTIGFIMHLERDFYLSDAFLQSNSQFVCESVRKFSMTGAAANRYRVGIGAHLNSMFKHIFPNVQEFHLKEFRQFRNNLNELWTACKNLESIHVWIDVWPMHSEGCGVASSSITNDSAFLGIEEEEAFYLLKNVEELESLEIVPTKPSIFNLRKLKLFAIHFYHFAEPCFVTRSNSPQPKFVTQLTGQCAFSRVPGLSVEIHRRLCNAKDICYLASNHLKPFVKFVESDNGSHQESF